MFYRQHDIVLPDIEEGKTHTFEKQLLPLKQFLHHDIRKELKWASGDAFNMSHGPNTRWCLCLDTVNQQHITSCPMYSEIWEEAAKVSNTTVEELR